MIFAATLVRRCTAGLALASLAGVAAAKLPPLSPEAQAKMKRDKSKPGEWVEGKTRVGRWTYEARKNTKSGAVEYINARGERNVATAGTPGAANFRSYAQIEAEEGQVS